MPFPSVYIKNTDNSTLISRTQPHRVAYVGYFDKGDSTKIIPTYSQLDFKIKFGKPLVENLNEWYQIYNYFEYQNREILIGRSISENSYNACFGYPNSEKNIQILNLDAFNMLEENKNFVRVFARNPGFWGNALSVAIISEKEYNNNVKIYKNIYIKNIIKKFDGSLCVCIFLNDDLAELFFVDNFDFENININSNYIYIYYNNKKCNNYDGNIHYVDGNMMTADGNIDSDLISVFFGRNIIKLSGGISTKPSKSDIIQSYIDLCDSDEFVFDFLYLNSSYIEAADEILKYKPNTVIITDYNGFKTSSNRNVIYYYGKKIQKNIFNDQNIEIDVIGDILGIRTYLINNFEMSESHCKPTHMLKNFERISTQLDENKMRELYDINVNTLKKGFGGIYTYSENMADGSKLTNCIIYNNLKKDCESVIKYYVFEHNDEITRFDLKTKVASICDKYKSDNNIEDYIVICDESNQINNLNKLICDVYFKPKYLVEEMHINVTTN